ncbi:ubiquitin carboxyl-terminal hydrolase MINDY-3-like [Chenopodium quinoa]|uniref:ubiquitinyl hydrolase 1 n=1 Tax=Chenopodium quinoa TaxID=63459 RepID=A0A803LHX5_CHEQI|nr:ubiquitin carboxyl-terminal hydrolase MINDY-3-like [Chenopodium quinoa]
MADQEEEELQMALRMSMQPPSNSPPKPKRSKPRDVTTTSAGASPKVEEESPELKSRRLQRELMAAAAEKRMMMMTTSMSKAPLLSVSAPGTGDESGSEGGIEVKIAEEVKVREVKMGENLGEELSVDEANQLFFMVFGGNVTKEVLAQWTNQGIRFSPDPETSMGLVQHEGGPCGVLATIQGFVLKYLLFVPEESSNNALRTPQRSWNRESVTPENFASLSEDTRKRALVKSMAEILFRCGSNKKAVVATLDVLDQNGEGNSDGPLDEMILKALEGFSIESASDLQKTLRVTSYTSSANAIQRLEMMLPVFESRMGAMLFLISALLSRGLESIQADRDDPSLPLVTAPFGHASQEIVNLLLCGEAVANVFDERIDLGGGMFLKGVSSDVEVGFLTLLESLNFCKVGLHLKRPKWPIWVVGSESHYTVLFAFHPSVQEENEMEERESRIRRAFDAQDQSGGGGFISVEGLHQVLKETGINLPSDKLDRLCSAGFIVWSEFWQVLLDLDRNLGGFKDSSGLMGKKVFDLYHFNGIAKSVINGNQGETPFQRPRITKLRVSVPPRWTPEEYMAEAAPPSSSSGSDTAGKDAAKAVAPEPPQHAPLVDCIRTRWARANCNWTGDPPSIV